MSTISDSLVTERLNIVEDTLQELHKKIDKIFDVIIGNENFDQKGIISRVKYLETENEKYKNFKNKLIGASFVGGGAFAIIFELVKILITK
jgi:hypothetical protein